MHVLSRNMKWKHQHSRFRFLFFSASATCSSYFTPFPATFMIEDCITLEYKLEIREHKTPIHLANMPKRKRYKYFYKRPSDLAVKALSIFIKFFP